MGHGGGSLPSSVVGLPVGVPHETKASMRKFPHGSGKLNARMIGRHHTSDLTLKGDSNPWLEERVTFRVVSLTLQGGIEFAVFRSSDNKIFQRRKSAITRWSSHTVRLDIPAVPRTLCRPVYVSSSDSQRELSTLSFSSPCFRTHNTTSP